MNFKNVSTFSTTKGVQALLVLSFLALSVGVLRTGVAAASSGKSVTLAPGAFANVKAFPNPWRSDRDKNRPVKIEGLPTGSTVKILTVSGRLVNTLIAGSDPNSVQWLLNNSSGDSVASGVYFYLITSGAGETARGKVVVIK